MQQPPFHQKETKRASTKASNTMSPHSCLSEKLSTKVTLLVGESRLEWPSFINHFSSCRELQGEHRGAGVFTPQVFRTEQMELLAHLHSLTCAHSVSSSSAECLSAGLGSQLTFMMGFLALPPEAKISKLRVKSCLWLIWHRCVLFYLFMEENTTETHVIIALDSTGSS